jgi:ABC-type multidrug transport system ATPase subunit
MNTIIKVTKLTKEFKEVKAVQDLSFTVAEGQVYGFLGQNGAGKSTTLRMLLTLIKPTSGEIEIFGMNLYRHRKEILQNTGAIIEKPDLYKYLTALENLRIFAAMSGKKISEKQLMDQLALVGLVHRAHSKVKTYSQGMKQRLGIAVALVHDPALIILDEPVNGLDPQGIADIRNLIITLSKEKNKTILISSHLLNEMEMIADAMLIIDKGKKIVEGNVNELFDPAETLIQLKTNNDAGAREVLQQSSWANFLKEKTGDGITLKLHRSQAPALIRDLVQKGIEIISINARHSLEDYFLSLTGHSAYVEPVKN